MSLSSITMSAFLPTDREPSSPSLLSRIAQKHRVAAFHPPNKTKSTPKGAFLILFGDEGSEHRRGGNLELLLADVTHAQHRGQRHDAIHGHTHVKGFGGLHRRSGRT